MILATLVLSSGSACMFASPATAATPPLQFTFIQYDSPGADDRTNASINKEYIHITNKGPVAINIGGFTLTDTSRHRYVFPSHIVGNGKSVYVHTGRGTNGINPLTGKPDTSRLYWGSRAYMWTNTGDTATLRTATRVYDVCAWTKIGTGNTAC